MIEFIPILGYVGTTATIISLAVTAASGAYAAYSQRQAGKAAHAAAMTEAEMTEAAARQADLEAREQIRRSRIEARRFAGGQRATVAGAGVVGTTGSPLDILGRTAALQELQIQDQARRAATSYTSAFGRAREIRVAGRAARSGANRAAIGTGLSTAAGVFSAGSNAYQSGALQFGSNKSLLAESA